MIVTLCMSAIATLHLNASLTFIPTPTPSPSPTPRPTPTATPLSYYLEGSRLHKLGLYDAAILKFTEAIKYVKTNPDAYKLRGSSYLELGNYKLQIMSTPGHLYDCLCVLVDGKLFTSDTLFIDGCYETMATVR